MFVKKIMLGLASLESIVTKLTSERHGDCSTGGHDAAAGTT